MHNAWWCLYCLCGGFGCTKDHVKSRLTAKCCICSLNCEEVAAYDLEGVCNIEHICCLCAGVFQWPPTYNTPCLICCNEGLCGMGRCNAHKREEIYSQHRCDVHGHDDEPTLSFMDFAIKEKFMCCYCAGFGVPCSLTLIDVLDCVYKCGCFRCSLGLTLPCGDDGWCMYLQALGRCHGQCRAPPKFVNNPLCACCGCQLNQIMQDSRRSGKKIGSNTQTRPKQQEMC